VITVAKGEDAVPKPAEAKPVADAEVHNTATEATSAPQPEAVQLPKPEIVQLPRPNAIVAYVRPYSVGYAPSYGYRSAGYHHCD
jgi:hypothetical protein